MSIDKAALAREIVNLHNELRKHHDSRALTQNATLDAAAQSYADKLVAEDKFDNDPTGKYGENLAMDYIGASETADPKAFARKLLQPFIDEAKGYDFNHKDIQAAYAKTFHFTQMVWKDTKNIGVGIALQDMREKYGRFAVKVCIKYEPAGNAQVTVEYKKNVKPPVKGENDLFK